MGRWPKNPSQEVGRRAHLRQLCRPSGAALKHGAHGTSKGKCRWAVCHSAVYPPHSLHSSQAGPSQKNVYPTIVCSRGFKDFSSPLRFVGKRQERLWQKDMLLYNKNIIKIKRQRTNRENVVTINRTKGLWVKRHTLWHICPLPTRMGKGQEKKNWIEQGISVQLHSSRTN